MADQSKNKTKDSPKVVAKTVDNSTKKDLKTTSPLENRATASGEVPNSAANAIAKNGVSANENRTAEKTVTKKKPPPPKKATDDTNQRLTKLEKLLESQAEQNQQFQFNILAAMNGMMDQNPGQNGDDDDDNMSNACTSGHVAVAPSDAKARDHQISDSEDDGTPPGDKTQSQNEETQPQNEEMEPQSEDNSKLTETSQDLGFAAMFATDVDQGGPIRNDVAKSLTHALSYKLEETKLKEAMERHKCPSNCYPLQTPMVNPQIWSNITSRSRSHDFKLQRVEKPLVKGLIAMSKLDKAYKLDPNIVDGLTLVANAAFELNCLRREMLKPDMNPQFHHLCKPPTYTHDKKEKTHSREYYSLLFGDELGKQVKELQEESKATYNVTKFGNKGAARYKPYPKKGTNAYGNASYNSARQSFHAAAAAAGWTPNNKPSFLGARQVKKYPPNNKKYPQARNNKNLPQKPGQSQRN